MKTCDLVIVGAGSVGLPAALAAARHGLSTIVLDACASPGQGDNKRAIGGVRATHSEPAKIQVCLRSIRIFSEWRERHGDDLGLRKGGYLFVAYRPQEEKILRDLLVIQKAHGLAIDWAPPEGVRDLVPDINPAGLLGGTYSPNDINLSPLRCAAAFHRVAVCAGADFHFRERVIGIDAAGGRVQAVRTDKDTYSTRNVLNAAGADAAAVGLMAGIDLPVFPDMHEAGITEPVLRLFDPLIVDMRPTPGSTNCYLHQNSENRIEFCLTPDPLIPGTHRQSASGFLPMIARRMIDLIPCLASIRVRRTWRGCYPQTPDGEPIVGSAQAPAGYHYAVGMCGQGLMLGAGLAEDTVSLITEGRPVTDPGLFDSFRLSRDFGKAEKLK